MGSQTVRPSLPKLDTKKTQPINHTSTVRKKPTKWNKADLILVVASTGGPVALEKVLSNMHQALDVPLLIVQHMPKNFTRVLAHSLDQKSGLNIVEAHNDMVIEPGKTVIAAGGYHMIVEEKESKKIIKLMQSEYVNGVRPAADVLFESISLCYNNQQILVVILTGMGSDGTNGIKKISENNHVHTITQSEETCVVYGMPRSIDEAGLSDESVPLDKIAARIESFGLHRR